LVFEIEKFNPFHEVHLLRTWKLESMGKGGNCVITKRLKRCCSHIGNHGEFSNRIPD
jgi:hypothetical protein